MSDQPENLVLVYLRRIDERLERVEDKIDELKRRMTLSEEGIGHLSKSYAELQFRLDRFDLRLDRIERRLDLQGAPA